MQYKNANRATTPNGDPGKVGSVVKTSGFFREKQKDFKTTVIEYLQADLSVIPVDPSSKAATIEWKSCQKTSMRRSLLMKIDWPGIGVICGKISGHMEALDFDFKAAWYTKWVALVETEAPGLVSRLLLQTTQSGGKHAVYRCPDYLVPGNTKLAVDKIEVAGPGDHCFKGKTHRAHQEGDYWVIYPTMIETRGEGGYIIAAPTSGYRLEMGTFLEVPKITPKEREILLNASKALTRCVKPKFHNQPVIQGDRPGDLYNAGSDLRELLENHGWRPVGIQGDYEHYTRPGKNKGISGSLIDGKLFYCFTSNAPSLEPDEVYTPFTLYTALKHDGDYEAAAKELRRVGYRSQSTDTNKSQASPDEDTKKAWAYARELIPRTVFPWIILPSNISESLQILARACATEADQLPGMALAMIGAAVGRTISVSPKTGWEEPVILWVIDIRHTGEGKTPPMQSLARVLKKVQKEEHDRFDHEYKEWVALPPNERDGPPKPPRGYYCTDLTLEGLRADLEQHPTGGIVALLNEASVLISGQNQYKKKGTDREAWLKIHDGDDARIVRASKSLLISGARVQVVGGIQPEIFKKVFGGDDGQYLADGTIYRCLFVCSPPRHHPLTLEAWSDEHRSVWEIALKNALQWADRQELPLDIKLTGEAQELFLKWRNSLDWEKTKLPLEIRGFLPKTYGNALRLAGAIDLLHQFSAGKPPRDHIDGAAMQRGIDAALYFLGQALDAMCVILGEELTVDPVKDRILESLRDRGEMTATDIYTDVFQKNKPAARIQESLTAMVNDGQVTSTTTPTEGRPKTTYTLNVKNVFTDKAPAAENHQGPHPDLNALNASNTLNTCVVDAENSNDDEVEI